MISEICLSAANAKCAGLSNSHRVLMPTCDPIEDTFERLKPTSKEKPKMLCKVTKDDQVACQLASNQQLLEQTKCFAVKCHFFWQFVCHAKKNPQGWFTVEKCSTDPMNAVHVTKRLARTEFDANRLQIQGWGHKPALNHHLHITYCTSHVSKPSIVKHQIMKRRVATNGFIANLTC